MSQITRRSLALGLPMLALAGCGTDRPVPATSGTIRAPRLTPPRLGDSDPVSFAAPAPDRYAVHGIDVARFQGALDWRQARAAGVNFAFIKATEGGDLLDPMFADHWRGAGRAGVARGAYHFYYFCTPPEVQARWFIRNVPRTRGMLPPVLDMEWNPFSPTCTKRPPGAEVRRQARIFLAALERHYGQRPIVYTTPEFYRQNDMGRLNEEFWLRATARNLTEVYPGQSWRFWQYTATGIVPGSEGATDLNAFNGSAAQWQAWLASRQV
ncbi:glycoside hydrolase family 25 protein [Aquicoccus porphyridii]|uniref:glycoside hydrolase family 25 protein n=1 Tax=Aquicoccus porphyridii TaxID=1852029 RepID=UPI00273D4AB8|nr:GH25 family lysozyme [Aquicoccus porphyridii]